MTPNVELSGGEAVRLSAGLGVLDTDTPLDAGIEKEVMILRSCGVETYESCEGSNGHSYAEPTIRFHGPHHEGFRALSVAFMHGLEVRALRRIWVINEGEPTGPSWEMTFWEKTP